MDQPAVTESEWATFRDKLRQSNVLYICQSERARMSNILEQLEGADVLTVSDLPQFPDSGGMIGLVVTEGRVAFDVNIDQIKKTQVVVSSKVLKLARRIIQARET
jgi:hypothetical protein